jgi:transposase
MIRHYVVADMTKEGRSTRQIAADLDVDHSTIVRDVRRARSAGLLPPPEPKTPRTGGRVTPRTDLAKTWLNSMDMLNRKMRSFESMRKDDRYRRRIPDLLRTRGDLMAAHKLIGEILEDFQAVVDEKDRNSVPRGAAVKEEIK